MKSRLFTMFAAVAVAGTMLAAQDPQPTPDSPASPASPAATTPRSQSVLRCRTRAGCARIDGSDACEASEGTSPQGSGACEASASMWPQGSQACEASESM